MQKFTLSLQKFICLLLLICLVRVGKSQAPVPPNLKLTDFAIWGGSASPNSYKKDSGVVFNNTAVIQGNIGSNHLIDIKNNFALTGNIYSGNLIIFKDNAKITGDIFANRLGTTLSPVITGGNRDTITGNLTAKGKIALGTIGRVTGKAFVPAPTSSNYSGPTPSGGFSNTLTFPTLPVMPNNSPFDDKVAANISSNNITNPTIPLKPGVYRKLALAGNKTLTFDGPGSYIFYEVDNGLTTNKFVFDFKGTSAGTINIFVIKDARWGYLSVSMKNGNFPSRIFTEIHGTGSTFGTGYAFDLQGPTSAPTGSNLWLGSVWVPYGGINLVNTPMLPNGTPHVIGALWSGKKVNIKNDFKLVYQAPAADPSYIDPYYPPPASGKVNTANNVIGAELYSLSQNSAPITSIPQNDIFRFDNTGKVMIEVISVSPNDNILKSELQTMGMTGIVDNGPHTFVITGYFPINLLTQLNGKPRIKYVRPLFPPINNVGQVTSQGDLTMRSNFVRDRFGLDGSGVKIGVISDSYDSKSGAVQNVAEGDLPGSPPVDAANPDLLSGSDEGRAMLQIAHDVAPKAKLAFRTGFLSAGHFAKGILELANPDLPGGPCDVIVDDITYITEPFQRDGIVAQTVNQVVSQGVSYFSSAGNFGIRSSEGIFNGVTNTTLIPSPGKIHQFGATPSDIYQTVNLKPGSYTIVLQWNDKFHSLGDPGLPTDLDLYLVGANGYTLFGFNRSNISGDPFEVCPFTVKEETKAKLMVVSATGTVNVNFKYIIFRGDATITDYQTGGSTIVGHPNAAGAIAVGAMLYDNIPPFTPVWPGVASFSSRGGTATLEDNSFITRNKPELIAPNGVNTTVNLGGAAFNDGDPYPNFFGTSAAAPHAAAVGALLIQGRKKFNLQTSVTPDEIRQQLQSSAGKFSYLPGNFSFEGGYGFVQADSAIAQIANARPIISTLEAVVPGAQNGALPFQVKVKGKYLTSSTEIYYNGKPVLTAVSPDKTEATATVSAIPNGQDPPFQLYNPSKSPSELDGGLSEALHFFSRIIDITVRAENKSRKFGQTNPDFTTEILYDGVPTNNPDTLAKLKLDGDNLDTSCFATAASNAGLYGIFFSRSTPLEDNDPLLTQYGFTFVSGTLSVGKMPLKITPVNKTGENSIKYGEDIGEITYTYELEPSASNSPTLSDDVKILHKKYLADNALGVLEGFDNETYGLSQSDLSNMSMMASFQAIRNARKFKLQDGKLTPLVDNIASSEIGVQRFIVDASAESLQKYKLDSAESTMVKPFPDVHARAFLNIKALEKGNAKSALPNGQLQAMVNGQLMAMVNGQLQAIVNGQLQALVNGQLMPLVNGQLVAIVNGQLQAMVNGQLLAMVNGQLMALVNGELQIVQDLTLSNGQLQAIVNGQLQAIVNGQLQAMVNGVVTVIPNASISLVNGQLQAIVNGQLQALVNGQLQALVNGQLQPLVNGDALPATSARKLANGQLQALVNGTYVPITNGQLQALVNGQLLAMVNGQLMAIVNGELTFTVFQNGQLQALVNGQLQALVNGQLQAMVNGQLQEVNSYSIVNGQLQAIVNNQTWVYANGQLLALVNGQLQALVNNFDVSGPTNNAKTLVLVDEDDINQQAGSIGAMFSMNMITGLDAGTQHLVPGAFVNENFEVTYGLGEIEILPALLIAKADDTTKVYGDDNPEFTVTYSGFAYSDTVENITPPDATSTADNTSGVGNYPIILSGGSAANYTLSLQEGNLVITKKSLLVTADDKTKAPGDPNPPLTISYDGFVGDDNENSVCIPFVVPPSPKDVQQLNRITTYTDVKLNGGTNFIDATPGQSITLTGSYNSVYFDPTNYCPGCITQIHIGMSDGNEGNVFSDCIETNGGGGISQPSGPINRTFNAPLLPGVYYVTQESTWWYYCGQFGVPVHTNGPTDAIAVVVVNVSNQNITATTTADELSPAGPYPITLQGCNNYNPNYDVTLQNGTLTVEIPSGRPSDVKTSKPGATENKITDFSGNNLYPNPGFSLVRLQLKDDVQTTRDIQIYDAVGKLNRTSVKRISGGMYEINVLPLSKGVYFIKVKTSEGFKTFRFIKI